MPSVKLRIHRLRKRLASVGNLVFVAAALVWRRTALRNVTLIAVTGSVGKTTAKECLVEILRRTSPTFALTASANGRFAIPFVLLGARPSHRFIVAEVGILKRGRMWRSALVLKPDVTVITHVNWQHSVNFASLDQIAEEKAKLLDPLGSGGLAILNADNPHVAAMAQGRNCRVRTFGIRESADVSAASIQAQWPDRLSLIIRDGGEERRVQTRFIGEHWAPSVLAAVTAARAVGAGWEACVQALAQVDPYPARLSPLRLPSGADLLRDEYNGSFETFQKALGVMTAAHCLRKVIAIGCIKDTPQFGDLGPEEVGRNAASVGNLLLFWGPFKERYRAAALSAGAPPGDIEIFETQPELADYICRNTGPGDLVLLKGFWSDHLSRVVFAQFGTVKCRLEYCEITSTCDPCKRMGFEPDQTVDAELLRPLLEGQARTGLQ